LRSINAPFNGNWMITNFNVVALSSIANKFVTYSNCGNHSSYSDSFFFRILFSRLWGAIEVLVAAKRVSTLWFVTLCLPRSANRRFAMLVCTFQALFWNTLLVPTSEYGLDLHQLLWQLSWYIVTRPAEDRIWRKRWARKRVFRV
jgi:hypothetical protein